MDKAEQTYKRAIVLRPKNAQSYSLLGAFYNHQARYAEAAQQLKTATSLAPDNSLYWAALGGVYIEAGNYTAAIEALQKSNSIRPSAAAYSNLGQVYFILRKFEDAINAFEQSVSLGDREMRSYGNLGRAYYWFPPKRRLARTAFLKAIQLAEDNLKVNPDDADAHTLASQYFAMIGNKTRALEHLNAALRLRPKDAETAYFAAIVHNQLGDRPQALSWIQKSVGLGYSPAEISATIELDSLHNDARFKSAITEVSARK